MRTSLQRYILILIFQILIFSSCSRSVIRQPISEIDRPLFLPPKNWQISSGAYLYKTSSEPYFFKTILPDAVTRRMRSDLSLRPMLEFQFPSFRFGNYFEYQIPLSLRCYLVRNMTVIDSAECISGLNLAISTSLTGLVLNQDSLFAIPTTHKLLLKCPFSKVFWFESGLIFNIDLTQSYSYKKNHGWDLELPIIIGFQPFKRLSVTSGAALNESFWYYHYYRDFGYLIYPDGQVYTLSTGWEYTTRTYDLNLVFPATVKYAFNRNWELTLMGKCVVYDQHNYKMIGGIAGSFTW